MKDLTTKTILIVDSDAIPRAHVADYLRDCGYRVMEANDGAEATTIMENRPVDILVSDVDLKREPGGFKLASWVRSRKPGIRVVLSSTVEKTAVTAAELCDEGPTLTRPYDPQQLAAHIRRMMAI